MYFRAVKRNLHLSVYREFEKQVRRSPDAIAVALGDERLTYAGLNARANHLAGQLIAGGAGPESLVGICMERSPGLIVAILAVLKAGAGYVPLDPAHPDARLGHILGDTGLGTLITERDLASRFTGFGGDILFVGDGEKSADPLPRAAPENLAYVIYTSGSTGKPKGVMVEHRNLTALFRATDGLFDFSARDVWTLFHSCAFDFSVWEMWGALTHGGRLEIVPREIARSGPEFATFLGERGVTVLNQTPSAFAALIGVPAMDNREGALALRHVIFGGEALNPARLKAWVARYRGNPPALTNMYGITETTVHTTFHRLGAADLGSPRSVIGRPLPHLRIRLAEDGEMFISGDGLARGYLNRPDLTAERFSGGPDGAREYRSGDLGRRLPGGTFEHLGRKDQQVKIRGYRIELGEIEAALGACENIADCAVAAIEDGTGTKRLVAYAVPRTRHRLDRTAIRAALAGRLPDHMVPSALVAMDTLPLTPNGKIDRQALPPPGQDDVMRRSYIAPRTELEALVAAVWATLLKLDRVGLEDDFFALGGDSLLATEMAVSLSRRLGAPVSLAKFFERPVLADFAGTLPAGAVEPENRPA